MKRQITIIAITLLAGIFLGWLLFHTSSGTPPTEQHPAQEKSSEIWTCAMHPQIRVEQPGKCPICAMDLIPLRQNSLDGIDPKAIHLTKEAAQLANVQTSIVTKNSPAKEVRLYGKIEADERLMQSQVSFMAGRVEKLFINFTGEAVRKGQPLVTIYSPDLITAQQELLESIKTKSNQPEIYEAAKEKLLQWKLTDQQILDIENSGKVQANMVLYSTSSGIVTGKKVNQGDYVAQGSVLYEISDLSRLWVQFDAYESDLQFLQKGNKIDFTLQALPGEHFSGNIQFIDQTLDPVTRIAKVRVELNNHQGKLKPEMFATGIVKANVDQYKDQLTIPKTAVLWTGKRSVVYLKTPGSEPVFSMREIDLGPLLGNHFVVTDGLHEGDEIVTQGVFSVDAAAQLEGKPSMMNNETGTSGDNKGEPTTKSEISTANSELRSYSFKVSGNCDMCKERIESMAKSVAGVAAATWNPGDKMLHLQTSPSITNTDAIQKKVADAGHDTEKFKASDEVYNKLPECCLYRK